MGVEDERGEGRGGDIVSREVCFVNGRRGVLGRGDEEYGELLRLSVSYNSYK